MGDVALVVTYEPAGGRPVGIVRIEDRALVLGAIRRVLARAESRAARGGDEMVANLQRENAARLRHSLEMVLPELAIEPRRKHQPKAQCGSHVM